MIAFIVPLAPWAGLPTIAFLLIWAGWLKLNGTLRRERETERATDLARAKARALPRMERELRQDVDWDAALKFYDARGGRRLLQ